MNPISVLEHTKDVNIVLRVAVDHDNRFLVVQEGKADCYGKWSFAGGKLDMSENLSTAAIREVKEETGVDINLTGILGIRHGLWDDKVGLTIEIYLLGKALSIPSRYEVTQEILAVEWKTLNELEQLKSGGLLRNSSQGAIIRYLLKGDSLPIENLFENESPSLRSVQNSSPTKRS